MAYINLTGDYGYKEYWVRDASGTTVNATNADWHIAGNETVPAINIYNSSGVVINGGEIWGEISQTAEWSSIYNHMATGVRVSNSINTTIRNLRIDGTWDGIRFVPDDSLNVANGSSNGWLIEDVRMTNIRDDAIENDFAHSGTLRDSLLDGVFSGFGTVNNQSAHGVLTVDDSIIIMKDYLQDGRMTHGSPFKFNTDTPENNPDLRIVNSIIAVQDPEHNGFSRMKEAWSNLTESSGNYFLNLSDTPFPGNYPLPPKGFTILQGKAARDFLASEKAKWLAQHDGASQTSTPELSFRAADFNGDGRDDVLWRHDSGLVTNWLGTSTGAFANNYGNTAINVATSWNVAGSGDFNGDGRDDILWRHDGGAFTDWLGQGNGGFVGNASANKQVDTSWDIASTGDFNGDGRDDVLWRHDSGLLTQWYGQANGSFAGSASTQVDRSWHVVGTGDFNGDGRDDILWRHDSGGLTRWLGQSNGSFAGGATTKVDTGWAVVGTGDFNGDGRDDILWRHDNGALTNWLGQADGSFVGNSKGNNQVDTSWDVDSIGDFNGDGRDDILWRHDSGRVAEWLGQSGGSFAVGISTQVDTSWHVPSPDFLI